MLLKNNVKRMLFQSPFEWGCVAIFLIYIALCLTPSSYGLVLNIFGMNGEGLLWGNPRAIRSDEWAVWTPYFQSVVNNDFSRFNHLSLYGEDFRGFSALPIYDWALIFKPLLWPFLLFSEAYAFSIHHALIMLAFIVGWKQLVDRLIPETQQYFISGIFSLLLFFSGFVQVWWTTLGPLLALTPWLFIVTLWCEKITPVKVLVFSYVAIVWLLSHTYPPIIISCVYIAILLAISFKRELLNLSTIIGLLLGSVVALAIAYVYLADAIQIMTQTVYPGKRVSQGGAVPWELWLSAFIPYINHSNYQPLLATNICELGVITSLLPMMAFIFVHHQSIGKDSWKVIAIFLVALVAMSLWMLVPVSPLIAKLALLDQVPGSRLLWALGISVNFLALYVLIRGEVRLNLIRVMFFSAALFSCYAASCFYYDLPLGKKSAWELIAALVLIITVFFAKNRFTNNVQKGFALLLTAMLVNLIYFGGFNPAQSAKPIFELKESDLLQSLRNNQKTHPKGWLVTTGYPGAVLQGLGFNSVTHVLMMPKLEFFRALFPQMDEQHFNQVFNRYAHIHLSDDSVPNSPQADVIRIPKAVFGIKEAEVKIDKLSRLEYEGSVEAGGYVDSISSDGSIITIVGWGMISDISTTFHSNLRVDIAVKVSSVSRPDVVGALKDKRLANSGFKLEFGLSEGQNIEDFCLYTKDPIFGVKKIIPGNPDMLYKCANK